MSVTYYVALPFIPTEDGAAPGEAQEMPNESAAIRRGSIGASAYQCRRARLRTLGRSGAEKFQRRRYFENVRRSAGEAG